MSCIAVVITIVVGYVILADMVYEIELHGDDIEAVGPPGAVNIVSMVTVFVAAVVIVFVPVDVRRNSL